LLPVCLIIPPLSPNLFPFSMQSMAYQKKVSNYFFQELTVFFPPLIHRS
jgi:hypothetical protein